MHKYKLYDPKTNTVLYDNVLKIPEFIALKQILLNKSPYKNDNVYKHTCRVTKCMINYINENKNNRFLDDDYRKILIYSSLLHDIGKSIIIQKDNEFCLYPYKECAIKGTEIAKYILDTYILDVVDADKKAILSLVRYHIAPLYIMSTNKPTKEILKLVNNLAFIDFQSLLLLTRCNCEGINTKCNDYKKILQKVETLYFKMCSYRIGTKVYLEKLKDTNTCSYTPGNHPNGINPGYITYGILRNTITVGYRTFIGLNFSTSPVIKIIDKNHFQTKNSLYQITENLCLI